VYQKSIREGLHQLNPVRWFLTKSATATPVSHALFSWTNWIQTCVLVLNADLVGTPFSSHFASPMSTNAAQ
jgi:hypothetical protein